MFNMFSFAVDESAAALSGATAVSYSTGASPGVDATTGLVGPASGLAIQIIVSGYSAGTINVLLQTAPSEADADGEWINIDTSINEISANGTYTLQVVSPIMDKVRLAYTPYTAFTGTLTPTWLCSDPITLVS